LGDEALVRQAQAARVRLEAREAELEADLAAKLAEAHPLGDDGMVPGTAGPTEGGGAGANQVEPGVRVWIRPLGQEGEVLEGENAAGEVAVQVGPMRMTVPARDLEVLGGPSA